MGRRRGNYVVFLISFLVFGCSPGVRNKLIETPVAAYRVTGGSAEFTETETLFILTNDLFLGPTAIFMRRSGDDVIFFPNPIYFAKVEVDGDSVQVSQDVTVTGDKVDESELSGQMLLASKINRAVGALQNILRSKNISVTIIPGHKASFTPDQEVVVQLMIDHFDELFAYIEKRKVTEIWINSGAKDSMTETYLLLNNQKDRVLVITEIATAADRESDFISKLNNDGFPVKQ